MREVTQLDVSTLAHKLEQKQFSSVELTRAYLEHIRAEDGAIGAYLTVTETEALEAAEASDRRRAHGACRGILDGIPFAVKDNLCTKGIPTTCASRMLEGYRPPYDATAVRRLYEQGAVLLGKLNMDEFAMGSSTEFSAYHPTKNPLDPTRCPGGSSGGSAAAVAAGLAPFTLGTDTGGSVRQPAAFCGVVGMKPTYGRVSRYGLIAFASSLDQIGPMTKTVADNALVLAAISGQDPLDSTTASIPFSMEATIPHPLRVGSCPQLWEEGLSPCVRDALTDAGAALRAMGGQIREITLPSLEFALPAYYVISAAEASSNLARFDGIRYGHRAPHFEDLEDLYRRSRSEGFGPEVKRRILLGTFVLSAGYADQYYKKAKQVAASLRAELKTAFSSCDLLLLPTAPTVAPKLGHASLSPTKRFTGDADTVLANLAGLPALSVPFGRGEDGMPIGIQLVGPPHSEALLYRVGEHLMQKGGESR